MAASAFGKFRPLKDVTWDGEKKISETSPAIYSGQSI